MMYNEAPVKFNDVKNSISKVQEKLVYQKLSLDESEGKDSQALIKLDESSNQHMQTLKKFNFESFQYWSDISERSYVDRKLEMDKQFRLRSENQSAINNLISENLTVISDKINKNGSDCQTKEEQLTN